MTAEMAVALARSTLETALWVSAPILLAATLVGLVISVVQVMTSIQETTVSTVPRLAAVAVTAFLLLPWIFRKLVAYTHQLFADFHRYVG